MEPFIPWTCLNVDSNHVPNVRPPPKRKTFAQVLNNACNIPVSQLPTPCIKGDAVSITIPEEEYQAGLAECKNNLHGRLWFPKGAKPPMFSEIKTSLAKQWTPILQWSMVSIGKGFLEFSFNSVEDLRKVLAVGAWKIGSGLVRMLSWSPDFYPSKAKNTNAQCWIRIFIPREYWRPKVLFSIARGVGLPLSLDEATKTKSFGQYARVLVDIDLSKPLLNDILVERTGCAFFVNICYERLPSFCSHCCTIGHDVTDCNKLLNGNPPRPKTRKEYRPKDTAKPTGPCPNDAEPVLEETPKTQSVVDGIVDDKNNNEASDAPIPDTFVENTADYGANCLDTTLGKNAVHEDKNRNGSLIGFGTDGTDPTLRQNPDNAIQDPITAAAQLCSPIQKNTTQDVDANSIANVSCSNQNPDPSAAANSLANMSSPIQNQATENLNSTAEVNSSAAGSNPIQITDKNKDHVASPGSHEQLPANSVTGSYRLTNDKEILSKFWAEDDDTKEDEGQDSSFQVVLSKKQKARLKTPRRVTRRNGTRAGHSSQA